MTFFSSFFMYPLTQTLIMEFQQVITRSGTITYLDVETGGLFTNSLYGLGLYYLGLGIMRYYRDGIEDLNSKKLSF